MADTPDLDAIRQRHERFEPAAHDRAVLLAEVERLRAEVGTADAVSRDLLGDVKRLLAERDRLVEGIREHRGRCLGPDGMGGDFDDWEQAGRRLWGLLDTSDNQEGDPPRQPDPSLKGYIEEANADG